MKNFCAFIVGVVMIAQGVLAFIPDWLPKQHAQGIVLLIAAIGLVAFAVQMIWTHYEEKHAKTRQKQQDERIEMLASDMKMQTRLIERLADDKGLLVRPVVIQPSTGAATTDLPEKQRIASHDPRIYIEIDDQRFQDGSEGQFPGTGIVLRNEGGDAAHKVQIQPISLSKGIAKFKSVEAIVVNAKKVVFPDIEGLSVFEKHDLARLLTNQWDANGILSDEFSCPIQVTYEDVNGTQLETTFDLVILTIQDILKRRHGKNWPRRDSETLLIRNLVIRRRLTRKDINRMPTDEYERKLKGDPEFRKQVDALPPED